MAFYALKLKFLNYSDKMLDYPTHLRAFLNILIQGLSSNHSSGCQELLTVLNTRSGCGIIIVTRPSVVVNDVIPSGEPFGLAGYVVVFSPRLSTYCIATVFDDNASATACSDVNSALPSPCDTAIGICEPSIPWNKIDGDD